MDAKQPLWDYVIRSIVAWFCRIHTLNATLIKVGGLILAAAMGGLLFEVRIPLSGGQFTLSFDGSGAGPALITYGCFVAGIVMILWGAVDWAGQRREERDRLARKRVFVIEQRGLRDTTDTPLEKAVPFAFVGTRDVVLFDLRKEMQDGKVVDPHAALDRILALPQDLARRRERLDHADISTVYGGLVSVPFAFLTGLLLDDESQVTIFDWDRNTNQWRALDGEDDGVRFEVSGLAEVPASTQEAILAVSVSYKADYDGIRKTLGDIPMVRCELPNGTPDCHWSEEKQQALARQFRETATALSNSGVRKLHVFIAAQNSMTFRFGRSYDKRNLPPAVVYQYERSGTPPYPWGVLMPVHGVDRARVINT